MSITITCEDCGHRHRLERPITEAGYIYIVCHSCELPLQALLEANTVPVPIESADYSAWSNILDVSGATPQGQG